MEITASQTRVVGTPPALLCCIPTTVTNGFPPGSNPGYALPVDYQRTRQPGFGCSHKYTHNHSLVQAFAGYDEI